MNSNILVSVIMPVYNSEKFISESIESIISQTHKNLEFILIYDESHDNTLKIINDYCKKDNRLKLLYNKYGSGIIGALNTGIDFSKGNFILRMDSDDISFPSRIEDQLDYIILHKLDICGSYYFTINERGKIKSKRKVPISNNLCKIALFSVVPFAHPSVLINKSFLIKHNLKYSSNFKNFAEDLILWQKMFENGARFGNIPKFLLKYRLNHDSISFNNKEIIKIANKLNTDFIIKHKLIGKSLINSNYKFVNFFEKYLYNLLVVKLLKIGEIKFKTRTHFNAIFVLCYLIISWRTRFFKT